MRRLVLLLLAPVLLAQDAWEETPLLPEKLDAALKETRQKLAELPDAEKAPYQRREALLGDLLATLGDRARFLDAEVIRDRRAKAETALRDLRAKAQEPVPAPVTKEAVVGLDESVKQAEASWRAAQAAVDELLQRQKQLTEDAAALPTRLADVERRLAAVNGQDTLGKANLLLERRVVRERIDFAKDALARWEERIPMAQLERDLAKLRYDCAKELQSRAVKVFAQEQEKLAKEERERAAAEDLAAKMERDPIERFRREIQADIARAEAERKSDEAFLAVLDQRITTQKTATETLAAEKSRLEDRLEGRAGLTERAGNALERMLERLQRNRGMLLKRSLPQLERDLEAYQIARGDVQDRLWELEAAREENDAFQALARRVGGERTEEAWQVFSDVVLNSGLVDSLRARALVLARVDTALADLEARYGERLARNEDLRMFVQGRLYWVRSDPPLSLSVATSAALEIVQLPARFTERHAVEDLSAAYRRAPGVFWGALAGLLAVVFLGIVSARRARITSDRLNYRGGAFLAGVQRILVAALLAARLPVVVWLTALAVRFLELPAVVGEPLARALELFAGLWFVRCFLFRLFLKDGIAVEQLRIPAEVSAQILRSIRIAVLTALCFLLPHEAMKVLPEPPASVMRLLYMAFIAGTVLALGILLGRRGALVRAVTREGGIWRRAWLLLGPLLRLGLFSILVLDVVGYRRGAHFLLVSVLQTFASVLLLIGVYHLLRRVVEKVAVTVRKQAVEAAGYAAAWEQSKTVTQQLTRVVSVAILVAAFLLIGDFWDAGSSFRGLFDAQLASVEGGFLTLWDVLSAILWIAAGHFIVSNLSGLYEFLVFPIFAGTDKAGQFVLLTLSRYAILLVAYSAALVTLRFSFQSIGWLLAAASVGLGFGLQEIVANFVSGLILLLERPIRVGDVISVGDTGGTVDRINIRATVVTNWDRQQIIVPNKNFITQNLTNWTRNDLVVRRKILIGVAYGTDVEKVLRILDEVVKEHPKVVKEPAHRIWFEAFGESSLDFEVWFFSRIDEGKQAMTDIRSAIARRFAEEDIEIPFPQRDLHVRSVEDPSMLAALLERRST